MNSLAIQIAREMASPPEDRVREYGDAWLALVTRLMPPPTAGWYKDPTLGKSRWWDGAGWGPMADEAQGRARRRGRFET